MAMPPGHQMCRASIGLNLTTQLGDALTGGDATPGAAGSMGSSATRK